MAQNSCLVRDKNQVIIDLFKEYAKKIFVFLGVVAEGRTKDATEIDIDDLLARRDSAIEAIIVDSEKLLENSIALPEELVAELQKAKEYYLLMDRTLWLLENPPKSYTFTHLTHVDNLVKSFLKNKSNTY